MQNDVQALLSEGLSHFSKGDHGPATECWTRVLQLEPGNVRAQEYLKYVRSSSPPAVRAITRPQTDRATVTMPAVSAPPAPSPTPRPMASVVPAAAPTPTPPAPPATPPPPAPSAPLSSAPSTPPSIEASAPTPPAFTAPSKPAPTGQAEWFGNGAPTPASTPLQVSRMGPAKAAPPISDTRVPGDPLFQEVLENWADDLGDAIPPDIARHAAPAITPATSRIMTPPPGPVDPAGVHDAAGAPSPWDQLTSDPASEGPGSRKNRRNPFSDENGGFTSVITELPTMAPSPATAREVPQNGDANADGLQGMWAETARPVAANSSQPVASPWDDGPAVASVLDLDRSPARTKKVPPTPGRTRSGKFRNPVGGTTPAALPAVPVDVATQTRQLMVKVKDHYALGDFSGSLELVEKVLELDEKNAEARDFLTQNETTLLRMYESKIGALDRIPRMKVAPDEVVWLNLHHKAGFVMSRVDGLASFDDILALSGMGRLETCRILVQLLKAGVISA